MKLALGSLNYERPSKIQAIAYMPVYNGSTCIVADQTGSSLGNKLN
jgi:superfamily II DNA/RNA helicase